MAGREKEKVMWDDGDEDESDSPVISENGDGGRGPLFVLSESKESKHDGRERIQDEIRKL